MLETERLGKTAWDLSKVRALFDLVSTVKKCYIISFTVHVILS